MSKAFDDREKALENKYFHDEEVKFRIVTRRRKFLGMWAAEHMHKGEEESLEYALEIVRYGVENPDDGAVVTKVLKDMQDAGIEITEEEVRDAMVDLGEKAARQIEKENKGER